METQRRSGTIYYDCMRFRFTLPRKGMETIAKFLSLCLTILFRFTLPRKGTETRFINDTSFNPFAEVSIYSSPQGDGNYSSTGTTRHVRTGFDLLFPARGRKP